MKTTRKQKRPLTAAERARRAACVDKVREQIRYAVKTAEELERIGKGHAAHDWRIIALHHRSTLRCVARARP